MNGTPIDLEQAVDLTRTGDVWLFRGHTWADRTIRTLTNAPVNHVGMALALDDLPPLMWHAELGRALPDMWAGERRRGAQVHDLRDAVIHWCTRYGQRAWLRQLEPPATPAMEDAALRTVARMDGTPFPQPATVFTRWARSRVPSRERLARLVTRRGDDDPRDDDRRDAALETAYCAEVVAATYRAMGLLPADRPLSWYDPGRFWSGDDLDLRGARLGPEIAVRV